MNKKIKTVLKILHYNCEEESRSWGEDSFLSPYRGVRFAKQTTHTPSIKVRVALAVMPEANAEGTLKYSIITTILNILIKTMTFYFSRRERQLCEVRTERQNRNFLFKFTFKNWGQKKRKER